jgi:hypothetical protein
MNINYLMIVIYMVSIACDLKSIDIEKSTAYKEIESVPPVWKPTSLSYCYYLIF